MTLCGMHAIWCQYESVGICDCGFTGPFHEHCWPNTKMSKISFYRPPSIDRLEQVTLKECPFCGCKSPELIGGHYVKCRFKTCDMLGPRKDPRGHKWNSIPRRSEVRELLRLIDEVHKNHMGLPEKWDEKRRRLIDYADKLRKELNL